MRGIGLKWPNDSLLPSGKVGGIRIEMQGDAMGPAQVVIGVGINLRSPVSWHAVLTSQPPACRMAASAIRRNALLGYCLCELEQVLEQFSREGFAPFHDEWEAHHAWQGCEAEIRALDGRSLTGTIQGVAEDGALRLCVDGQDKRIYTGDVSLRRVI